MNKTLILSVSLIVSSSLITGAILYTHYNSSTSIPDEKISYFDKKQECAKYADDVKADIENELAILKDVFPEYFETIFYSPKEDSCIYVTRRLKKRDGSYVDPEYMVFNVLTKSKITSFKQNSQMEEYRKFLFEYSDGEIRL